MIQQTRNYLPTGAILHSKSYDYIIKKVLGQGAFGITYLAEVQMQGALGSLKKSIHVAIKEFFMKEFNGRLGTSVTCPTGNMAFLDYRNKFKREALHLSELKCDSIVKVLEYFEDNGTGYYSMEYIDGISLEKYITDNNGLPEFESLIIMYRVGEALQYMHENRMLHLDLKPQNIMRKVNGQIVLIDFGLSKHFDNYGEPESSTCIGLGTTGYAPIEQASYKSGEGFPATLDIYALGATLFKCLTGNTPPSASTILNDELPEDTLLEHSISTPVLSLLRSTMIPLKKQRLQTVDEFLKKISDFLPFKIIPKETRMIMKKLWNNRDLDGLQNYAAAGNRIAQRVLGLSYLYGKNIEKDHTKAVRYLIMAANQDDPWAQTKLGQCYMNGCGIDKNEVLGFNLFLKASRYGDVLAEYFLGTCYKLGRGTKGDPSKAAYWLSKAARKGYVPAQANLGQCYKLGIGVEKDFNLSIEWFKKAAEQDYALAQTSLGLCYKYGYGTEQNKDKALYWFTQAASKDEKGAYYELAICYINGYGVDKDFAKAIELYTKSAELGFVEAQYSLGNIYETGKVVPQNHLKAVDWHTKAANAGHIKSSYNLGLHYLYGHGVEKNRTKAIDLISKAAAKRYQLAIDKLEELTNDQHNK